MTLLRTGFSIRETKLDHNGLFWPDGVHFGPYGSANRTVANPDPGLNCLAPSPAVEEAHHIRTQSLSLCSFLLPDSFVSEDAIVRGPQTGGWIRRGSIWRFRGAPIFSPEAPRTSGRKIGAPQKRQTQPRRILGPLKLTFVAREPSQKFKVMKFEILGVTNVVDFWWQYFWQLSPGKIGLQFVTEDFTTFVTASKEICHLELTLGVSPRLNMCDQWSQKRLQSAPPSKLTQVAQSAHKSKSRAELSVAVPKVTVVIPTPALHRSLPQYWTDRWTVLNGTRLVAANVPLALKSSGTKRKTTSKPNGKCQKKLPTIRSQEKGVFRRGVL